MFKVRCFKPYQKLELGHNFYVLNRGLNSGRPSYSPNPNCFVVSCNTREEREQLFWACKALHINYCFRPHLVGSVIELLRIGDFRKTLENAMARFEQNDADLAKSVLKIGKLAKHRAMQEKSIGLIDQLQKSMLAEIFIK